MMRKFLLPLFSLAAYFPGSAQELTRLSYNNPGLTVDLGVGLWAWPLPMDFDGDGRLDLVVNCPDKPSNGTTFRSDRRQRKDSDACLQGRRAP